jgi:hypothetical protein
MQQDSTYLVQEITIKVKRLLEEKNGLLDEVEALKSAQQLLKSEIQLQKNTIETLQTQNKIVKLAEILPSTQDVRQELKKQLSAYIKQIDDCIRLLSE